VCKWPWGSTEKVTKLQSRSAINEICSKATNSLPIYPKKLCLSHGEMQEFLPVALWPEISGKQCSLIRSSFTFRTCNIFHLFINLKRLSSRLFSETLKMKIHKIILLYSFSFMGAKYHFLLWGKKVGYKWQRRVLKKCVFRTVGGWWWLRILSSVGF
jgi:hypothetical protein